MAWEVSHDSQGQTQTDLENVMREEIQVDTVVVDCQNEAVSFFIFLLVEPPWG